MAEHAESSASSEDTETRVARRAPVDWRRAGGKVANAVASIVRWVGLVFAAILVIHVIFTVGSANPDNGIVSFVHSWADGLALGFSDLFTPTDAKLRVLVNFGIAAIFWLVVSGILAKVIRRVGGGS
ncbi:MULTISPECIES: hypothetical protein [unclassified Amycolatopsis]|uniref:hypothetical protein n=1 Tax=unclassified Amycolatopsis TaxID=2618356 RepID=UPI002E166E3F|nr:MULTISPECIES: hypothetical protein [unclassified Amycolatopsis]WSJ74771.1 hypothetical protein OG439_35805 [Amycolatopsis sp. NBC_01307]WSK81558.1 hypothetical protein OG570_13770 [Amycolatopsis sp. NBC_01286]